MHKPGVLDKADIANLLNFGRLVTNFLPRDDNREA